MILPAEQKSEEGEENERAKEKRRLNIRAKDPD